MLAVFCGDAGCVHFGDGGFDHLYLLVGECFEVARSGGESATGWREGRDEFIYEGGVFRETSLHVLEEDFLACELLGSAEDGCAVDGLELEFDFWLINMRQVRSVGADFYLCGISDTQSGLS